MVKVCAGPGQPASVGVTVMVPVVVEATFAALKEISPVPFAAKPMAVLLLVQLKTGLTLPEKMTSTGSPAQTVWLGGSTTVGVGLTVTSILVLSLQLLSSVAVNV